MSFRITPGVYVYDNDVASMYNSTIVGYTGSSAQDVGIVYAPYTSLNHIKVKFEYNYGAPRKNHFPDELFEVD